MFYIFQGYLFRGSQLCVRRHSVRETLIKEYREGGLGGHFGEEKTIALVSETLYWPKLSKDVIHIV